MNTKAQMEKVMGDYANKDVKGVQSGGSIMTTGSYSAKTITNDPKNVNFSYKNPFGKGMGEGS